MKNIKKMKFSIPLSLGIFAQLYLPITAFVIESSNAALAQSEPLKYSSENDFSTKELSMKVTTPTTPIEILQNIKFVIDHHLLLRDDFYSDENLLHFFGGSKLSRSSVKPEDSTVEILGYESMVKPIPYNAKEDKSLTYDGLSITIWKTKLRGGGINARLVLTLEPVVDLTFNNAVNIFGNNWVNSYIGLLGHRKVQDPTDSHGNQDIKYKKNDNGISQIWDLEFRFDGKLRNASFTEIKQ